MDELLSKYLDMFHKSFPLFQFMGVEEEKVKRIIQKCIEEKTPCKINVEENVFY